MEKVKEKLRKMNKIFRKTGKRQPEGQREKFRL
jgi:hypothetical protein